jgi:hypothetical protein
MLLGWTIWEWPSTMIEAEFHAVWRSPAGELIDVSPKGQGESVILFVEQPDATYDFSRPGKQRDNARRPLSSSADVRRFIELGEEFYRMTASEVREVRINKERFQRFAVEYEAVLERLRNRRVGKREPCPCGSGGQYGRCCGRGAEA